METRGDFVVHFSRGPSWASLLLRAHAAGRLSPELLWSTLLAHADDLQDPDVASLLMHLPWPGETVALPASAPAPRERAPSDDWFVVDDGVGAA
jgi:hypothetical protein